MGALAALGLAGYATICFAAVPTDPAPPAPSETTTTPAPTDPADAAQSLKLVQDPTSRLTIAVMVNGQGPFEFLIDTGSDRTVISRELAATLKLADGPSVTMHESAGVEDVKTVIIDHLVIGNHRIDHIEAPALGAVNLGAAGMLGVDALHDLHIVMDFKAMRLSSSPSRPEPTDGHTIIVHGRSRFGQLILVDAEIHGVPVYVVLDSGSQLSVGNPALLKLLTGGKPSPYPKMQAEIVSVSGRKMMVELDDIAETHIGGLEIRNMPMAFAQLHTFDRFGLTKQPALLLGMDVLRQCQKVSVDLRRREATFTLN
ncbi:MAG TPA: aspartyl protease family protein [Caulobacteraceae bacterium]